MDGISNNETQDLEVLFCSFIPKWKEINETENLLIAYTKLQKDLYNIFIIFM